MEDDHKKEQKGEDPSKRPGHEAPMLGDFNTTVGGFFGGGYSTSSRKRYSRAVIVESSVLKL